ncbi:hypothetical protein HK102_013618, partial [Quaeritorhiza haematococci]
MTVEVEAHNNHHHRGGAAAADHHRDNDSYICYTGNFESDYLEACKRLSCPPMRILKIASQNAWANSPSSSFDQLNPHLPAPAFATSLSPMSSPKHAHHARGGGGISADAFQQQHHSSSSLMPPGQPKSLGSWKGSVRDLRSHHLSSMANLNVAAGSGRRESVTTGVPQKQLSSLNGGKDEHGGSEGRERDRDRRNTFAANKGDTHSSLASISAATVVPVIGESGDSPSASTVLAGDNVTIIESAPSSDTMANTAITTRPQTRAAPPPSRYRFTPTITLEVTGGTGGGATGIGGVDGSSSSSAASAKGDGESGGGGGAGNAAADDDQT